MADIRIFGSNAVPSNTGNGWTLAAGSRQGAIYTSDWKQQMIADGRAYGIHVGNFVTAVTGGGAGTILDIDQPEALVSVPSGTSIFPMRISFALEANSAATDNDLIHALITVTRTAAWDGAGTATTPTIYNLRTDNPRSSGCTARTAFTADITTAPVSHLELGRYSAKVETGAAGNFVHQHNYLYEPQNLVTIVGPAMLLCYFGGTAAVAGYLRVSWIECPSTWGT
jgi:hypothetical protein